MSLGALREAIEKLDEPAGLTRAEMVDAFALRDRLDAWLSSAVGAFDRDVVYELDGAASTVAWLRHYCRQTNGDAARTVTTARKLQALPHVADAWRSGELSSGHARAVAANVPDRHIEKFASVESTMVPALAALTVGDATAVMQQWKRAADDADPKPEHGDKPDELHLSETLEGRRVLNGHLCSDNGVEVEQALTHAMLDDPAIPLSQRLAYALVVIARFYNDHNQKAGGRRNRPSVTIVVREQDADGDPVGATVDGRTITVATLARWLCDSTVTRLLVSKSGRLDYGTAVRTVPVLLWLAIAARDQGCRFPGCDRKTAWCEAHHVKPFSKGGKTAFDNLALFCSHHHHKLHGNDGWSVSMEANGTLHVTAPDGTVTTTVPPLLRDTLWPPGEPPE